MTTSNRPWRHASGVLAAFALCLGAATAQASVTTVTPGQLAGAATHPYAGPASPILYFNGENPTDDDVATALGYTGEKFCTRLNSPPGPSGTVVLNGVEFNYVYDPVGQNMYFNWDASAPMLWVTAKGGNSAYVFVYTPQSVDHDLALRSPTNDTNDDPQGLSHFDFCFKEPPPSIEKTATARWVRYYDWTLSKTVNGKESDTLTMLYGEQQNANYLISGTPFVSHEVFEVSGTISVKDPIERGYTLSPSDIVDQLDFNADPDAAHRFNPVISNCGAVSGDPAHVIYKCDYKLILTRDEDIDAYEFLAGGGGGSNHAEATLHLGVTSLTIDTDPDTNFAFAATPDQVVGNTLAVSDSITGDAPNGGFSVGGTLSWSYSVPFLCGRDKGPHLNTATGQWVDGYDSQDSPLLGTVTDAASVIVVCNPPPPTITKTASGRWDRYYTWTLGKVANPNAIEMFYGDQHDAGFTITGTPTEHARFTVSGTITVSYAASLVQQGLLVDVQNVADSLIFSNDPAMPKVIHHPVVTGCAVDATAAPAFAYRCSYSFSVDNADAAYAWLAAGQAGVNEAGASVTVTPSGESAVPYDIVTNPKAPFDFTAPAASTTGGSLRLDDDMVNGSGGTDHTLSIGDLVWTYDRTFTCAADHTVHTNTVSGTWDTIGGGTAHPTPASDNVDVTCRRMTVSKTAIPSFDRTWTWTPDKQVIVAPGSLTDSEKVQWNCSLLPFGHPYANNYACDQGRIELAPGQVYNTNAYIVNATRTVAADGDSNFKVSGMITVSWPQTLTPDYTLADVLAYVGGPGNGAIGSCSAPSIVGTEKVVTCPYSATLPAKVNGTNTATATRKLKCYDEAGNEKACAVPGTESYPGPMAWDFGAVQPTNQTNACVDLYDLFNNSLDPAIKLTGMPVCDTTTMLLPMAGQDFDIVGVLPEPRPVPETCEFTVPNVLTVANGSTLLGSDNASLQVSVPALCNLGCTLTQGYWKTHTKHAKQASKRDITWDQVAPSGEDSPFYHSGQSWYQVFQTAPKKGNAYYILAHQFMAATLNQYAGASTNAVITVNGAQHDIGWVLVQAGAWFAQASSTPNMTMTKAQRNMLLGWAGALDDWNNGLTGPGHCSEAPVRMVYAHK